jgi:fumarylacetoacetase
MSNRLNETHDSNAKSWVDSANRTGTDFPIQNLPFGVFRHVGNGELPRIGVAIGDQILDMTGAEMDGFFEGEAADAAELCQGESLNELMSLDSKQWSALRLRLHQMLRSDAPAEYVQRLTRHLVPMANAEMLLPTHIGDYTDFYASVFHATNVGSMFRPDNPLLPNYKYIPIAYHGRSSSIVPSGTPIFHPKGQMRPDPQQPPTFGTARALDYELEVGFFVGDGNMLGHPIPIDSASEHIFGLCLVNDWSARDIQTWEYQPLGPFLANQREGGIDLTLEVRLRTAKMRDAGAPAVRLSRGSFRDMYWTIAQMLTHHASNGCNLRPGDMMASGTVSGPVKDSRGCLLELTWRGSEPIALPTGETRKFLEDGDEVILSGYCERKGAVRIGFGECRGEIVPGR